jgi:hypothetical protein
VAEAGVEHRPHGFPERLEGIQVGLTARQLHFLHATQRPVAEGTRVGSYTVHFTDGESESLPLVYGRNIRDWWLKAAELPLPDDTVEAWGGTNAESAHNATSIRLFKWTWTNPQPGVTIASIDFEAETTESEPFLVALTAEP